MSEEAFCGFFWGALEDGCSVRGEISASFSGSFALSSIFLKQGLWSGPVSRAGDPDSTTFMVLAQLWDTSSHFFFFFSFLNFLENHLTVKVKKSGF